jgi:hypothetical protein
MSPELSRGISALKEIILVGVPSIILFSITFVLGYSIKIGVSLFSIFDYIDYFKFSGIFIIVLFSTSIIYGCITSLYIWMVPILHSRIFSISKTFQLKKLDIHIIALFPIFTMVTLIGFSLTPSSLYELRLFWMLIIPLTIIELYLLEQARIHLVYSLFIIGYTSSIYVSLLLGLTMGARDQNNDSSLYVYRVNFDVNQSVMVNQLRYTSNYLLGFMPDKYIIIPRDSVLSITAQLRKSSVRRDWERP